MTSKIDKSEIETQKLLYIDDLKVENNTSDAVFGGVKALNNWKKGKKLSQKEYEDAINEFLKKPINGMEVKKNA